MLETYNQEILRKKRASRIFWLLVFSFAGFLYFFFQGYYPSVDFSLKELFSSGGLYNAKNNDLMKSFGIVNVKVEPRDAKILLSGSDFGNDEKRMVNYDNYTLSIGKPGYIQSRVRFSIDRETPYYIDRVTLIPRATYIQKDNALISVSKGDTTTWIGQSASGMIALDSSFSGTNIIPVGGDHIGEGYYLSGGVLFEYDRGIWNQKSWIRSRDIISTCDTTLQIRESYLWCPRTGIASTADGKTATGIIDIRRGYLRTRGSLITRDRTISLSVSEQISGSFIEREDIWYIPSRGSLVPIVDQKKKISLPLITTPLDTIKTTYWSDGILYLFGNIGTDTVLVRLDGEKLSSPIPFPDISLSDMRIEQYSGNTFFKTKSALLFLYNNSEKIEWLVDGEILAFSSDGALYKKDGEIWRASWGEKE